MKRALRLLVLVLLICGAITYYYFSQPKQNQDELILYGNVDIRQVDLGFRVYGRVQSLHFDEGDYVRQGQLMASLEKAPYVEQVNQSKAAMRVAEANLKEAEAKLAKRTGLPPSVISKEDYDDALYTRDSSKATLEQAEAGLAINMTNLEDAQIFCPTDGWILTRIREPGSIVNIGDPVFTLSVKSPVWIRAYVSEPNLGNIYPGMEATVHSDTTSMPSYVGHIGFISPVAEFTPKNVETTSLRTDLVYRLRIIIDQPDQWLRQGMPVTVRLKLNERERNR